MPDATDRPETPPLTDFRFGAIAVWGGMVDAIRLEEVLAEQAAARARGEEVPRIGELLLARGLLTEEQVSRVLRVQLQRLPDEGHLIFGQIAEVSKLVSSEHVTRALDEQSRAMLAGTEVRRIGEILLDMGCIDEEASRAILAFQATADPAPLSQALGARHHEKPADTAARDGGNAFLPRGIAGAVSDNVIWVVLGIAAATALVLAVFRDAMYG